MKPSIQESDVQRSLLRRSPDMGLDNGCRGEGRKSWRRQARSAFTVTSSMSLTGPWAKCSPRWTGSSLRITRWFSSAATMAECCPGISADKVSVPCAHPLRTSYLAGAGLSSFFNGRSHSGSLFSASQRFHSSLRLATTSGFSAERSLDSEMSVLTR